MNIIINCNLHVAITFERNEFIGHVGSVNGIQVE